jgi:hypothetical protein
MGTRSCGGAVLTADSLKDQEASASALAILFKKCPTCGPMPRSAFYRNSARPDGLQSSCKACHKRAVLSYQAANRPGILSARRARYWADPDTHRDNASAWARAHRPACCASEARYRRAKPWKHRAKCAARRARMTAACFTWSTPQIEDKYALAELMSQIFQTPYEVDHRQPLSRGGPHVNANLDVIARVDNRRKHNHFA